MSPWYLQLFWSVLCGYLSYHELDRLLVCQAAAKTVFTVPENACKGFGKDRVPWGWSCVPEAHLQCLRKFACMKSGFSLEWDSWISQAQRVQLWSTDVCCCGHPVWLPMPALILVGETFGTCSLSLGPGNGVLLCCLSSYRSPVHIESNLYVTFMTKPVFLQYFRKIFSLAQILTDCKNVLELQVVDKYLLGFRWCWCWPGA